MAKKTYVVHWRLEHDNKVYKEGELIDLEDDVAERLMASGTTSPAEPEKPKLTPTQLIEQEAASFDPPVDLSSAKNNAERQALIDARKAEDAKKAEENQNPEGGQQTSEEA